MELIKNKNIINNTHTFYRAVVEDRNDPLKLNRVRVRIMGIHSPDDSKIPSNTLPWAEISHPAIYGGQNSGIGITSIPVLGTWVWVFFDAGDWNRPIIVGTMFGIPTKQSGDYKGFYDPDSKYPLVDRLDEQDTNRLANQNKFDETPIKKIKDANIVLGTTTATGEQWDELEEKTSKAVYPDNHVIETISGNFVEFDDTPGNSRMHWFHKSGTYWEALEEGDYSTKIVRDHYEIIDRDVYRLVKRNETHTIQANQEYKIDGWQEILIDKYSHEVVNDYVFQEYNDYFHNITQDYVLEEYHSYQHTIVDDYVLEEYHNYQHTIVDDYVLEEYHSTMKTEVDDDVTQNYHSKFSESIDGSVNIQWKSKADTVITGATTMSMRNTYDLSVSGSTSEIYHSTLDRTIIGSSTDTRNSNYSETVMGSVTASYNSNYNLSVMGSTSLQYNSTLNETVNGPVTKSWNGGAQLKGGSTIIIRAPMVIIN